VVNPCYYGIDFPDENELVAAGSSLEEVQKKLQADRLIYIGKKELYQAIGLKP